MLRVLTTGGTIASCVDASGMVVPAIDGESLLAAVPGLDELGAVEVVEIDRVNSWNVTPAMMVRIAEAARTALLNDGARGVVVTHGTDTLEETLYLVDLLAGDATTHGGVTFTGAMRPASDLCVDGPRNLLHAATVALHPDARGRGVLLCLNDEIHAARWATKTDTTNVSTFRSPPAGPVGTIERGGPRFVLDSPPRPPRGGTVDLEVALVKVFTGMDDALLRWVVDRGAHGLVIEGTGSGNVPGSVVGGIKHAIGRGVPVVLTSRCWTGRTVPIYGGPGGGQMLDELGVIRAGDLPSHKARLALMVALGLSRDRETVRAWFAGA